MSKLNAIRTLLKKALMTFERIATDKALLEWDGEGDLEVGMAVHGVDEEGNSFDLEDGEYTTDEGTVYVIAEGKVTEIREPDGENESETTGDDVQPEEETQEEENAEEEAPAEPEDDRIANLEAEIARLEEENGALREENEQLRARIDELENKPAAEPAAEEFEKVNTTEKTGNKRLDNLNRILNA